MCSMYFWKYRDCFIGPCRYETLAVLTDTDCVDSACFTAGYFADQLPIEKFPVANL